MSEYYTGLDVSMGETAICIINAKGRVVFESTVPTDPKQINDCLKASGFPITKMSLESGSLSHWLIRELLALEWNITCMDARSIAAVLSLKPNKTDRNDAKGIAEAVRTQSQYVKEVYQKSQESIELGTLLNARRTLVGQRTALSNTMRGLLKSFGICLGSAGENTLDSLIRKKLQEKWPKPESPALDVNNAPPYPVIAMEALITSFTTLAQEVKAIDSFLLNLSKKDEVIKRLITVPGVGPLTALTYKVTIDEPTRFKNAHSIGAYLGMCPTLYASGQTRRQGRISKRGNTELRTLLAASGLCVLTLCKKPSSLKTWGAKIEERQGKKKAAVAVGRKIAIIMHRLWCKNTVFDTGSFERQESSTSMQANS